MRLPPLAILGLVVATLAAIALLVSYASPAAQPVEDALPNIVYFAMLALLVGSSLVLRPEMKVAEGIRYAAIWLVIFLVIVLGYSLRHDFANLGRKVFGELAPSVGIENPDGTVSLRRSANGHFMALAEIRGPSDGPGAPPAETISVLVDTGASSLALSRRDAARIGIDPDTLAYTQFIRTANGTNRGAPVRLSSVTIGGIRVTDVRAMVVERGLEDTLLGLSFLDELTSYTVSGDELILTQ